MHAICDIGEDKYFDRISDSERLNECLLTFFCLVRFCDGLRGEELYLADLL